MSKDKQIDYIIDLLTDFDEMGFAPTTPVPDPEGYAIEWRKKLTNALQDYRKQSEWISVDERLPKDKQMCLVYGTVYYVPDEHSKEIMVTKFYEEFGFVEQIHANITHWMPFPEPPKMKGGASE